MFLFSSSSLATAGISGLIMAEQPGAVTELICVADGLPYPINHPAGTLDTRPGVVQRQRTSLLWGGYLEQCDEIRGITVKVAPDQSVRQAIEDGVTRAFARNGYDVAELDSLVHDEVIRRRGNNARPLPPTTTDYARALRDLLGRRYDAVMSDVYPVIAPGTTGNGLVTFGWLESRSRVRAAAEARGVLDWYEASGAAIWRATGYHGSLIVDGESIVSGHI